MKVMIELPKKTYTEICERTITNCGEAFAKKLVNYIKKGTPVDKSAKLIDANEFIKHVENLPKEPNGHSRMYDEAMIINMIEDAPAAIVLGGSNNGE